MDYLHELNFWMSSGGTRSVIHYDADHNIHCLIAGRKDFMMMNKNDNENYLYMVKKVCAKFNYIRSLKKLLVSSTTIRQ